MVGDAAEHERKDERRHIARRQGIKRKENAAGRGSCGQVRKRAAPLRSAPPVTTPLPEASPKAVGTKGVPADFDGLRRVEGDAIRISGILELFRVVIAHWPMLHHGEVTTKIKAYRPRPRQQARTLYSLV
jgi:hypothetical protein